MTIGFTNALQTELTSLGTDTQLSHQMVKYMECSTWKERFGTKTSWSGGIPHKDNWKVSSQQAQEYHLEARQESGQDGHKTQVVKKICSHKRYMLLTRVMRLWVDLSECNAEKSFIIHALVSVHFCPTSQTN